MALLKSTILGGLPIVADINFGQDYFGEYYSEVDAIYWRKKDGSPGKEISQKVYDRAEKYDTYFSALIENAEYPEPEENDKSDCLALDIVAAPVVS